MDSYSFIYYNITLTIRGNNMTDSKNPIIGVVMGSDSDWPIMKLATEMLNEFNVPYESKIVSAHRTPDIMYEYAVFRFLYTLLDTIHNIIRFKITYWRRFISRATNET